MLVIIIIAVILGVIAGLVSAIFGLDFETVFIWCVLSVCGLGLLLLLNPIFWQGYIRVQRERRARSERRWKEWCELHKDELRRQEREIERQMREEEEYGKWEYNWRTGEYERHSVRHGTQTMDANEYDWRDV